MMGCAPRSCGGDPLEQGVCLLEAVSYIAGEEFSDHPQCVSPVLGAYGRRLNDWLADEDRQKLKPFIPQMIGTAAAAAAADAVIVTAAAAAAAAVTKFSPEYWERYDAVYKAIYDQLRAKYRAGIDGTEFARVREVNNREGIELLGRMIAPMRPWSDDE